MLLDDDEVLTDVSAGTGAVIDSIHFSTNARSFTPLGSGKPFTEFVASAEIVYFTGY